MISERFFSCDFNIFIYAISPKTRLKETLGKELQGRNHRHAESRKRTLKY